MKKYEKPAIEIVEANLSADCLQTVYSDPSGSDGPPGVDEFSVGDGKSVSNGDDFAEDW